jgi:hypothetical protein
MEAYRLTPNQLIAKDLDLNRHEPRGVRQLAAVQVEDVNPVQSFKPFNPRDLVRGPFKSLLILWIVPNVSPLVIFCSLSCFAAAKTISNL